MSNDRRDFFKKVAGAAATLAGSTEGGDATADVVEEADESCAPRKHLGNVRYEEIQISCGTGMSAAFYQWLQSVPSCDFSRRSGAILAADFNFKEITRLAFTTIDGLDCNKVNAVDAITIKQAAPPREQGCSST